MFFAVEVVVVEVVVKTVGVGIEVVRVSFVVTAGLEHSVVAECVQWIYRATKLHLGSAHSKLKE